MSKSTKLYPIKGRWLHEAPTAVHVAETKAEADALIASGAFTDDPNHADRNHDAPDLTVEAPAEPAPVEPPAEPETA